MITSIVKLLSETHKFVECSHAAVDCLEPIVPFDGNKNIVTVSKIVSNYPTQIEIE